MLYRLLTTIPVVICEVHMLKIAQTIDIINYLLLSLSVHSLKIGVNVQC